MKGNLVLLILVFSSTCLFAQTDTLRSQRGIFVSKVFENKFKKNNTQLEKLYINAKAKDAQRSLKKSKFLLPMGAVTTAAGVGIATHALIGTQHVANIDGKDYIYYKRPIFQVLGGLGLATAGICIMELGNDAKIKSVKLYNKRQTKNSVSSTLGITTTGQIRFSLNI